MRPDKDRLYSGEGQMGALFMCSPYTLRGAPSGYSNPRKRLFIHFLLLTQHPHLSARRDKHTKGPGRWIVSVVLAACSRSLSPKPSGASVCLSPPLQFIVCSLFWLEPGEQQMLVLQPAASDGDVPPSPSLAGRTARSRAAPTRVHVQQDAQQCRKLQKSF